LARAELRETLERDSQSIYVTIEVGFLFTFWVLGFWGLLFSRVSESMLRTP